MGYNGTERRIHKVFVTRNTEYHVRKDVCVGVRDRRSGSWLRSHLAVKTRVLGALRFSTDGGIQPNLGAPRIGDSLFFQAGGRDLVTSTILAVERPEKNIIRDYT
ncbi:MAG: hypothetical protein R3A78_10675 [Polyangiales bacterium]|nr:hypothetical protein [Myxococcales bacterium]